MSPVIRLFYYGDNPEEKGGNTELNATSTVPALGGGGGRHDWPLWEVFIRSRNGLTHKHVGSLHASDATMAVQAARDLYTRWRAAR